MNLRSIATGLILTHSIAGVVLAQEPQGAAQTEVKAAVPVATVATTATALVSEKLVLREGADVNLKFSQDLSSKTATEDDPVNLVLDQDLKIGDIVIAKAGRKGSGNHHSCQKSRDDGQGWRTEHAVAIADRWGHEIETSRHQRQRGPGKRRHRGLR